MRNLGAFLIAFVVVIAAVLGAFTLTQGRATASAGGPVSSLFPPGPPGQDNFYVTMMMVGENHRWLPGTITVRKGDKVTLHVVNGDDDTDHGFTVPALGITVDSMKPGEEKTITFTADKAGIFNFKCAKDACAKDHARQTGQIIVLP